jgi:hypothetical protein
MTNDPSPRCMKMKVGGSRQSIFELVFSFNLPARGGPFLQNGLVLEPCSSETSRLECSLLFIQDRLFFCHHAFAVIIAASQGQLKSV